MKKRLLAGLAIAALIGATMVSPADARGGGGGGMGGGGGWHGGGGWSSGGGGWHGGGGGWQGGGHNSGNWHGSGNHGNWGGWHNSGFHGHGHSHFFGTSLFIGVPFAYWWGYPYWYWDPWYYGYYGPSYYGPSVVYDGYDGYPATAPAAAPAPSGEVRWYCPDSGYYPTVRSCERGWMRVVPGGQPPESQQ